MKIACSVGIDKPFLITVFAVIATAYLAALADADFEEMYNFGPVPFCSEFTHGD
jgi:hypothetical protein